MIFKSATKIVTKRLMSKKVYIAIPFVSISDKATKIPGVTKKHDNDVNHGKPTIFGSQFS